MLRRACTTLLLLATACSGDPPPAAPSPMAPTGPVIATTWPLTCLAEAMLAPEQSVRCLVPPGEDPAFWQPADSDLQPLIDARGLLWNGAGFETWMQSATLAPSRTLEVGQAVRSTWIENTDESVHSHGASGAHTHRGFDPHLWMDPLLCIEMARAIGDFAIAQDWIAPSQAAERLAQLEPRLRELDRLWTEIAKAVQGRFLFANHGTYTYPARRYGIEIRVRNTSPEGPLDARTIESLSIARAAGGAAGFLWESTPEPGLAAELQNTYGLASFVLRPMESPLTPSQDAIDIWRQDLTTLLKALQP
ncbi:MAG: metal ABC transporter substrate-binding protein [Planctomycetota bacterium]